MFWKKGGIDYDSPEFRLIEVGTAMIEQTAKRRRASLHLLDIARGLRMTVEGSSTGWRFTLSDFAKIKFTGVLYVDQDGILTNEGRVGVEGYSNAGVGPPQVIAGMVRRDESEPVGTRSGGPFGFKVLTGNCDPGQPSELLPVDFTDPSILFSGPSSTGFTGIFGQCVPGTRYSPFPGLENIGPAV